MTDFLTVIETIGEASLALFWGPLLVWTGVWAMTTLVLRASRRADPSVRHRSAQGLLFALPAGLILAAAVSSLWGYVVPEALAVLAPAAVEAVGIQTVGPGWRPVFGPSSFTVLVVLGGSVLVWLAVAVASMLRLAHQARAANRLLRALIDTEVTSDSLADDVSVAARAMRVRRVPRVVVTSADVVPMTLGAWRPVVVVPASLDSSDRRLALAHEFAHVARQDPLAQYAEALVTAVFAAHPAVRHLARNCALLRELACDAAVLDISGVCRPSYAALLLRYAVAGSRPPAHAVGIADGPYHVHHRLTAMTHPIRRSSRFARAGLVSLLTLVAGLAMTAGSALAQTPRVLDGAVGHLDQTAGQLDGTVGALDRTVGELDGVVGERDASDAIVGTVEPASLLPQPTAVPAGKSLVATIQLLGVDTNVLPAILSVARADAAYVEHRMEGNGALTLWFAFADTAEQASWRSGSSTLERLDAAAGE